MAALPWGVSAVAEMDHLSKPTPKTATGAECSASARRSSQERTNSGPYRFAISTRVTFFALNMIFWIIVIYLLLA
jgi:hypothetical protein